MKLKWTGDKIAPFREKALFRKGEVSSTLPLHIALVIDCSKSMGDKIGKIKQALYQFLERLDSATAVGIVSLGEGGVQIREALTDDFDLIKSSLAELATGSSSPLGAAIFMADEELLRNEEAIRVILLFSDGQAKDEATTINAANKVRMRGTRLISVGIGSNVNRDLLQEIASSPSDYQLLSEGMRITQKLSEIAKDLRKVNYFPISVSCLIPGRPLDFNLFVKKGENCRLFLARSLPFDQEIREKLEQSGTEILYVHGQDRSRYRRYLEACLDLSLLDRDLVMQEKGRILYSEANDILEEIFRDPRRGNTIKKAANVVEGVLEFLFSATDTEVPFHERLAALLVNDHHVYTHSVNVCLYGVALAHFMRWDTQDLHELGLGLLLHDVGKSWVPPSILEKPSSLSPEEWEVIKQHPTWGADILRGSREAIPRRTFQLVEQHHEKLDGSGYPRQLKAEEIQLFGRLAAVVDVYDAMTCTRSYRQALTPFEALKKMGVEMAGQLDREILRNFILFLGTPG